MDLKIESKERMPAAQKIEEESGERLAPILEHAQELAGREFLAQRNLTASLNE